MTERLKAADDIDTIHRRIAELRAEKERVLNRPEDEPEEEKR